MKKKSILSEGFILVLVCLFLVVCLPEIKADAASRMKNLEIGKTYSYSLNGKTKNEILCTYTSGSYGSQKLNIYIDGKHELALSDQAYGFQAALCKISSKRTLISVRDMSDNGWCNGIRLYEYKSGSLKQLGNLAEISRDGQPLSNWARGDLVGVGKNSLTVSWLETTKSTGVIQVIIQYRIAGRKIVKTGDVYQVRAWDRKNSWTAKQKITAYNKPGGKKSTFVLKPGKKVKIVSMAVKNQKQYLKVRNTKGKTGWYEDPSSYDSAGWFKEARFAG